jgi:predicted nucleic acid-binding protein
VLHLDSSAIIKLVVSEPEPSQLVDVVRVDPEVTSSALAWTEVVRAVRRAARKKTVLEGIALVPIDDGIIRGAADLAPPTIRTLDAIHLATVIRVGDELASIVTYDLRLAEAAGAAGLQVLRPGVTSPEEYVHCARHALSLSDPEAGRQWPGEGHDQRDRIASAP